jgi:hypothetical protein
MCHIDWGEEDCSIGHKAVPKEFAKAYIEVSFEEDNAPESGDTGRSWVLGDE